MTATAWFDVWVDVDKSKFFDANYAVLEGDIAEEVTTARHRTCQTPDRRRNLPEKDPTETNAMDDDGMEEQKDDATRPNDQNSASHSRGTKVAEHDTTCTSTTGTNTNEKEAEILREEDGSVLLRRGERCFITVRQNVHTLHRALVPRAMAKEREEMGEADSTGWLRHEFYGIVALVQITLPSPPSTINDNCDESHLPKCKKKKENLYNKTKKNKNGRTIHHGLPVNKRGIKCLDFAGQFVNLYSRDRLNTEQKHPLQEGAGTSSSCPSKDRKGIDSKVEGTSDVEDDCHEEEDDDSDGSIICDDRTVKEEFTADNDSILTIKQSDLQQRLTRHKHFARWLVQTFGFECLQSGSGVLDVAGGNGKLAATLVKMGIPCTIVDPNPMQKGGSKQNAPNMEKVQEKSSKNHHGKEGKREIPSIIIVQERLEGDGRQLTEDPCDIDEDARSVTDKDDDANTTLPHTADVVRNCSIVVGLHPDEATEAVVDLALRLAKPFAVLPCCVMTKLFPDRRLKRTGDQVRTVWDLCRYLLDKGMEKGAFFQVDLLPFAGRNKVIYSLGPGPHPSQHQNDQRKIKVPMVGAMNEPYCREVSTEMERKSFVTYY